MRTRFLQLRHFKEMLRLMFNTESTASGVSSFQALAMTLAGRVGTGNIAGVATAITFGGPGAIFWMWMVAFLGASSAFVESTLGQVYKERSMASTAAVRPSTSKGPGPEMVCLAVRHHHHHRHRGAAAGGAGQFHRRLLDNAFGIAPTVTAAVLAIILGFIIFGGVKRIALFAGAVVPFMALGYIIVACVIIALNIEQLPGVMALVLKSAFGMDAGFGAILGLAIQWGEARRVFE